VKKINSTELVACEKSNKPKDSGFETTLHEIEVRPTLRDRLQNWGSD